MKLQMHKYGEGERTGMKPAVLCRAGSWDCSGFRKWQCRWSWKLGIMEHIRKIKDCAPNSSVKMACHKLWGVNLEQ